MYEFLEGLDSKSLISIIKKVSGFDFSSIGGIPKRENIVNVLFTIYGYQALSERNIRLQLYLTASDDQIEQLSNFLDEPRNNKSQYDYSLFLSLKKWSYNSSIAKITAEIFAIPTRYLPSKNSQKPTVSTIKPAQRPPALFDYQLEISEKIKQFLGGTTNSSLVQIPTGSGKTRTSLQSCLEWLAHNKSNSGILWIAHSAELCEQAATTLEYLWPSIGKTPLKLIRLWGNNKVDPYEITNSTTVISYNKLNSVMENNRYCRVFSTNFEIVIIDEAHRAAANVISKNLGILTKSTKVLGLTATPGRALLNRDENRKLSHLFGSNIITSDILGAEPIRTLQEREILSEVKFHKIKNISNSSTATTEFNKLDLTKLANDSKRNNIILDIITSGELKNKQVLLFSCTVKHAKQLALQLTSQGINSSYIDYNMSISTREDIIQGFKSKKLQCLCNFGVLSTGFDAPGIEGLIITRPTNSIVLFSQMVGRALRGRKVGGNKLSNVYVVPESIEQFGSLDEIYSYFNEYWE